jgi:hypothetical protein
MKAAYSWTMTVNEKAYLIEYNPNTLKGKQILIVNGMPINLKTTFTSGFAGLDQLVWVGDKQIRFVLINGKADLAVDGYYLNSKQQYIPLLGVPKWAWIFAAACIAIPIYSLGGAIPAMIGFSGFAICIKVSVSMRLSGIAKVGLCVLATGIAWLLMILFQQFVYSLL